MRPVVDMLAQGDAAALAKRARHQRWMWCRLSNDFFDNPIWRVVSELTAAPLYQVQAFVGRLECLANKSEPRGYVGDFRAVEFGAALGMPAEQAARIFAALEHIDVAWIDQDHVTTFDARNPDRPDVTAPERDRRRKARHQVRKYLGQRFERGGITEEQRDTATAMLGLLADRELFDLRDKLRVGVALEAALSTAKGHAVAHRDSVASHARADHSRAERTAAVDNSGETTRGEEAGHHGVEAHPEPPNPQAEAARWLLSTGLRMLVDNLQVTPQRAETLIERWRRDLNDDAALAETMRAVDKTGHVEARFHVMVTDRLNRLATVKQNGPQLALPPGVVAVRHDVTVPAVDKPTAAETPATRRSA